MAVQAGVMMQALERGRGMAFIVGRIKAAIVKGYLGFRNFPHRAVGRFCVSRGAGSLPGLRRWPAGFKAPPSE